MPSGRPADARWESTKKNRKPASPRCSSIPRRTPERGALWAAIGCVLIGLGLGFTNNTYLVSVQSSVGWHERGIATSSNLFARLMGQSLGAAIFGSLARRA